MITIDHISPALPLSPFVQSYQLLQFDTGSSILSRPWYGMLEHTITFFLKDKPLCLIDEKRGILLEGTHNIDIVGLSTRFNGLMNFRGQYQSFMIQFAPSGLAKLLGLPLYELTNKIYAADDVLGTSANALLDQLQHASDLEQMASFADKFLMLFLNRKKYIHLLDAISKISVDLSACKGMRRTHDYANMANMSLRNFERRFNEDVGFSPKMYCRLLRFNEAVRLKMQQPEKDWTSIAYECGYYDQMHMNKDFKQFADASPTSLFSLTPPPTVQHSFFKRT